MTRKKIFCFSRKFYLFILSVFDTTEYLPFRISRLILEHHLSNILLVDKRSRLLRKMHL